MLEYKVLKDVEVVAEMGCPGNNKLLLSKRKPKRQMYHVGKLKAFKWPFLLNFSVCLKFAHRLHTQLVLWFEGCLLVLI